MTEPTFETVFEDFTEKVRAYNSRQRKQILQATIHALMEILNSMPAPRREDANDRPMSPTMRRLVDTESLIYDRMHQLGYDKSLFSRYDPSASGRVSSAEFDACIQQIGIALNEDEKEALRKKYDTQGDGSINYQDFWKYLQALAESPMSTTASSFSSAVLNRNAGGGKSHADAVAALPEKAEERMQKGLKQLRENMYQRSSNFHSLFAHMQNHQKQVEVDAVIAQLQRQGFPTGIVNEQEMKDLAMKYSVKTPGFFTYPEFLAFVTGNDNSSSLLGSSGDSSSRIGALDSSALLNSLVKLNNINLRNFFKELDSDGDGLITTAELSKGMVESGGLNPATTQSQAFIDYAESFSKKRKGYFGYAEFLKFAQTRLVGNTGLISGEPAQVQWSIRIPDDATPSNMMDLIVRNLRPSNLSVESIMGQFDIDNDGALDEVEFYQGLSSLGFVLTKEQSKALFDALDTNKNGRVEIAEINGLIVNPNRHQSIKLSTRVRHVPGGASSVPMGSYARPVTEEVSRPSTARTTGPKDSWTLAQSQQLPTKEEMEKMQPKTIRSQMTSSTLDLSFNPNAPTAAEEKNRPSTSAGPVAGNGRPSTASAAATPAANRVPPGGRSSIDFVNDHGAAATAVKSSPEGNPTNRESDVRLLTFDPSAPVDVVRQRSAVGGVSNLVLTDEIDPSTPRRHASTRVLQSPGGDSTISFNQADFEVPRASKRVLSNPGGNSTLDLKFTDVVGSPSPVAPVYKPTQMTTVDLSFDPHADTEAARRVRKAGAGGVANASTVQIAHPTNRDSVTEEAERPTTGKRVAASPPSLQLGSGAGADVLASYAGEPAPIDAKLIEQLSNAIYAHSQRLRHTFQEWNRNATSATLSKQNFVAGARSLKVNLSDAEADALFARFDADNDGEISYSEFVRMLATK